ncbi:D-serine dehydratase [Pararhizobium capsulatum DSM 1112]|uniref:D-serine dehydratase n=1 Tax=Pararhizobium capsulatum DSM 1112 TaxID=1121113 RepID=A0ABU0C0P7_9HYPH|nr:alanine racemase [Pararhizobium capsulatum]MDQ0324101.1 D-serine dehydratase [Pararhizobium capsulatum DSM 1112]
MSNAQAHVTSPLFPALIDVRVDSRTKGMPGNLPAMPLGEIGAKGWNLLRRDLPTPLAVLDRAAVMQNSRWISAVTTYYGVSLCPHGKTTMAPQLFRKQLDDGCWGITLSTQHHVQVARHYGVSRIFLANQILDTGFLTYIARTQIEDPNFEFYFLVDSVEGAELLDRVGAGIAGHRPFQVLIELGSHFARTGCRTEAEARAIAERIARMRGSAVLVGIEGFEGSIRGADRPEIERRIEEFLGFIRRTAEAFAASDLFGGREIMLTAGGSAYFDLVAKALRRVVLKKPTRVVLRSGCYISHDAGMYEREIARALERSPELAKLDAKPAQALTVWATVQSRPEPGLAFLNAGRRDVSYDAHLPRPLRYASGSPAMAVAGLPNGHEVIMLNDQHAYLKCPEDSPLRPGDLVELGISHPCTTFDKWDVLCVLDESFDVVDAVKTFF